MCTMELYNQQQFSRVHSHSIVPLSLCTFPYRQNIYVHRQTSHEPSCKVIYSTGSSALMTSLLTGHAWWIWVLSVDSEPINRRGHLITLPVASICIGWLIAERLSTRQLILHRISPSVCMFMCVSISCFRNAINMQLQRYVAQQLLYTSHTRPGVCIHATCVHIHCTTTDAATGWTATIKLDVLLPLGNGSRGRQTANFGRLRQLTY